MSDVAMTKETVHDAINIAERDRTDITVSPDAYTLIRALSIESTTTPRYPWQPAPLGPQVFIDYDLTGVVLKAGESVVYCDTPNAQP